MLKQSLYSKLLITVCSLLFIACSRNPDQQSPLQFGNTQHSLGAHWAGEHLLLEFPFLNNSGKSTVITRIQTQCGCINPRVIVAGENRSLPAEVAANESGFIEIDFNTAGFKGTKKTGAEIFFDDDPQSVALDVSVFLNNWFRQQPARILFPESDGLSEQRINVIFTGQEPFTFVEVLSVSPPLQVELPVNALPALSQNITLVLPAQTKQGSQTATFSLRSDHDNFHVVSIVRYSTKPPIFVEPNGKLLLGQVPMAVASFAAVDLGANSGSIEVLKAEIEGIEQTIVRVQELEDGKRFRLQLSITPPSKPGAFSGELIIDLIHHFDGKKVPVTRKIQIFGVTPTTH
jgi:hypothetical protein